MRRVNRWHLPPTGSLHYWNGGHLADRFSWKGVFWSGLIAGILFMMLQMILVTAISGGSFWGPPRMVAAIALGPSVLPPPGDFALGVMIVAMIVHFALSFFFAAILAWIISAAKLSLWPAIIAGIIFGLVVYVFDFYVMTGVFPWFAKLGTASASSTTQCSGSRWAGFMQRSLRHHGRRSPHSAD